MAHRGVRRRDKFCNTTDWVPHQIFQTADKHGVFE